MAEPDPWSVVAVEEDPEADPWAVKSVSLAPGQTGVSPAKRTLRERFEDNIEAGRRETLFGAGADALAANLPGEAGAFEREQNRDEAEAYRMRSEADPFYKAPGGIPGKVAAGAATLGGVLAGGVTSPEALLGPGKTALGRIVANAAINAGLDVPVQLLQNEAGSHEGLDPWRVVASGAAGAAIQGGGEAAVAGARAGARGAKAAARAAKPYVDAGVRVAARKVGEAVDAIGANPVVSRALDQEWAVVHTEPAPTRAALSVASARSLIDEIAPGSTHTSGYRDPAKNAKVGGAKGSYHTRGAGQAIDFVPPKGVTLDQVRAELRRRGLPVIELLDEGDHYHWAFGGKGAAAADLGGRRDGGIVLGDEFDLPEPARPAARQAADDARAEPADQGPEPGQDRPDRSGDLAALDHIDDNHADLYRLGKKAAAGELDLPLASDLARRMSRFMDWSEEEGLSKRERQALARGEGVNGRRLIDTALEYARQHDEHGPAAQTSFYDPDRAVEAMAASRRATPSLPKLGEEPPIPATPSARAEPEPPPSSPGDITDRALDMLRKGEKVRVGRGPTLLEWAERFGLTDEGGELRALDADRWHRGKPFRKRLIREGGRSPGDAAVAAQELGYLPERFGEEDTRATPQDLYDAIRAELAGQPRYAFENPEADALRQYVDDLDEILNHLGIDPSDLSNAEIKRLIDASFSSPEPVAAAGGRLAMRAPPKGSDEPQLPGLEGEESLRSTLEREQRRRAAGRRNDALPDDSLFDQVRRGEQDMFPPSGKLGMFAGRGSKTANVEKLAEARQMEAAGANGEAIRASTGWFRGDDGQWRYEFTDHDSMFREDVQKGLLGKKNVGLDRLRELAGGRGLARLDSIIHHPRLFAAYPALRKMEVAVDDLGRALAQVEGETLTISRAALDGDPGELRGVVLHEIQHAIQDREKFAMGASGSEDGLRYSGYGDALDRKVAELRRKGYLTDTAVGEVYNRSAGEIEARNTQFRKWMDEGTRTKVSPEATRDIRREEAVVVRNTQHGPKEVPRYAEARGTLPTISGGLRHAREPKPVAEGKGEKFVGKTVTQLARDLRVALSLTHRQGRLHHRRALGEYGLQSGVVRTRIIGEIDALAHEAAHAIEFAHKPKELLKAMARHEKLLATFDYEPVAARRHEGFAEWFRWYVTNPDVARKLAPNFYDEFELAMHADMPKPLAAIQNVQRAYSNLLKSDSTEVLASSIAHTGRAGFGGRFARTMEERGVRGATSDVLDQAYTWYIDDLHPIAKAVGRLEDIFAENHGGRRLDLKAADNPYVLARLSREAYAAGRLDTTSGVVPYHGVDPEGPSLSDAIAKALGDKGFGKWSKKDLDRFDAYLAARRMVHEWDRFDAGELTRTPDKMPKEVHAQAIKDFEAKHPTWRDAAAMVYQWTNNLWRKEYEAGFLTEAAYEAGLAKPDYVPLHRDVSDKKGAGRPNKAVKGAMRNAGGVRRFGGSHRDVISPLTALVRRSYELNALIKRNEVIRTLDDLAQKVGPGGGALVERLPPTEVQKINVDALEALEKAARERGVDSRDLTTMMAAAEAALGGDGKTTVFRNREMDPKAGETVVWVWREGNKIPLMLADGQFGQDMFTAISGMDKEMANALVDVFSVFTQTLRHGVTLSPEFVGANILRDQIATWINTDVGFVPGFHYAKGAVEQARQGQLAKRYQAVGGMRGGLNTSALTKPFPRDDASALRALQELNKKGQRLRVFNPVQPNPLRALAALTDLSETGTRLGVMGLALKKAKARGLTDYEAGIEAGITSRDYLDFGRHGSKMLSAVRTVTFLNAAMQGLDKAARVTNASGFQRPSLGGLRRVLAPIGEAAPRTAGEKRALRHAYTALAKISALAVMGGALRLLYLDDPEYEEFSPQVRATHWLFRAWGHWFRFPKPFELAEPSNIVERYMELRFKADPKALENMLKDFGHAVMPPYEIPALMVPGQIARNRDYAGRPIVPDHLVGTVDPAYQFNAYTSKLSKTLGEKMGVSPAVLDHIVTGFGGSLGRYALQGSNLAVEGIEGAPRTASGPEDAFLVRRFTADPARGSASQKQFWDLVSKSGGKFTEAEGTVRMFMRDARDKEAAGYVNKLDPDARAYVLAKVFSQKGSSKLHPLVRAQEVVSILSELRRDVRDGSIATRRGTPITLTPEQRRRADDALADLSMAEMRDALITIGTKGWAQKAYIPRAKSLKALREVDPRIPALIRGLEEEQRVLPAGIVARRWKATREGLEAPVDPERFGKAGSVKRLKTGDRTARREEAVRQVREAGVGQ